MITPRNRFLGHPCNAAKGFYKSRATAARPPLHRGLPHPGRPSPHVSHKVLQDLPSPDYRSPSALTLTSCVTQGDFVFHTRSIPSPPNLAESYVYSPPLRGPQRVTAAHPASNFAVSHDYLPAVSRLIPQLSLLLNEIKIKATAI